MFTFHDFQNQNPLVYKYIMYVEDFFRIWFRAQFWLDFFETLYSACLYGELKLYSFWTKSSHNGRSWVRSQNNPQKRVLRNFNNFFIGLKTYTDEDVYEDWYVRFLWSRRWWSRSHPLAPTDLIFSRMVYDNSDLTQRWRTSVVPSPLTAHIRNIVG